MGRMPDGWLDYTPIGKRVEGTRFISFKVPLMMGLNDVPADNRLNPDLLLQHVPNLGLIIDLTDTTRYYRPEWFVKRGLSHEKIAIRGRVLPPPERHQRFRRTVDDFLEQNADNDKLIGVHCTHGCNRTGLMICTYLVQTGTYPPKEAIAAFESARGHAIHRDNYIAAINGGGSADDRADAYINNETAAASRPRSWRDRYQPSTNAPTTEAAPRVAASSAGNDDDAPVRLRWHYDSRAGVQVAQLTVQPHHLNPDAGVVASFFVRVTGPPPNTHTRWTAKPACAVDQPPRGLAPQSWLHWQPCERSGGQVARLQVQLNQLIPDGRGAFRVRVTGTPPMPPRPPSRWLAQTTAARTTRPIEEGTGGAQRRRKSRVAHMGSRGGPIN